MTRLEIATAALEDLACNYGDYPPAENRASEALIAIRAAPVEMLAGNTGLVELLSREWPEQYKPDHWNEQERSERPRIVVRRILQQLDAFRAGKP